MIMMIISIQKSIVISSFIQFILLHFIKKNVFFFVL